ncbi:MAG: RluA family pseudouridine synthase [Alphaproteobacteria bacterium]|nr:RluA family pseudouridine synthase [Alphaproteobacteria bacterium]
MSRVQHIEVKADQAGIRLDRWFKTHFPHIQHGRLEQLLRKGQIRVDGCRAKANIRLTSGQTIRVPPLADSPPAKRKKTLYAPPQLRQEILNNILYKDAHILALNKPAGLAVQGGSKTPMHLDGLLDLLTFDADERPRLVHRLDRDTSGVMVLARTRQAAVFLTKAFAARKIRKIYWGLTLGVPRPAQGDIDLKLIKQRTENGQRMRPANAGEEGGLRAITRFYVMARAGKQFAWTAFMPLTGRTHQIRAHALAIGHPLIGDEKYVLPNSAPYGELPKKLHLHAYALVLPHPADTGKSLSLQAPLTGHMAHSWELLGFDIDDIETDPFPPDDDERA